MCGICGGRFAPLPGSGLDPAALVRRMTDVQRHRGPDDEGFFADGALRLGFRRLSIIDVEGGHQPLGNEDGSIQVVLNGEIYNFRELRARLESRHTFRTRTDTEVVAHLYEEKGDDCFAELNGMFGVAIVDRVRRRLVLARDRAGVKPLYWALCGRDFVFGSEIKAILEHPECSRELDPAGLVRYLGIQYVPGPGTAFRHIQSLEPGHRLVLEGDAPPRIEPYWTFPALDPAAMLRDRGACARELAALVEDSVRMRLVSDVPLGALLSGGLDSSIVVGLMARHSSGPVVTVSVGFDDAPAMDETGLAEETARHFGTEHHAFRYGRDEALGVLPDLVRANELPIAEPLLVPSFFLFREARRHVTVVLSGEGADELFGGYMRYRVLSELRRLRPFLPRPGWRGWDALRSGPGLLHTLGKVGRAVAEPVPARSLWEWNSVWSEEEVREALVDPALAGGAAEHAYRSRDGFREDLPPSERGNQLMGIETENRLVDFILNRADKMSMANSLELRTPFLDYRLIEYSRRIPTAWKVNAQGEKRILRDAFAGLLPPAVLHRPKRAFQSPYRSWLTPMARRLMPDSRLVRDRWFRRDAIDALAGRAFASERSMKRLWTFLVLEMWYRAYIVREELPALVGAATVPGFALAGERPETVGVAAVAEAVAGPSGP
jgi:asparagine synthase (glutamine-hydrolysing)